MSSMMMCVSLFDQEGCIEFQCGWDLCNVEPRQHRAGAGLQGGVVWPREGGVPLGL